jgi:outer membrane protein with beta-barrel domain
MQRGLKTFIVAGAAALVLAPIQARADGFVSPWIGSAFGSGDGIRNGVSGTELNNGQTTFGVTAGGMGAGIIGGEVDFGYSPSFFGDKTLFGSNTVMNLMGNVIIGIPIGGQHGAGIRPYFTGGLGLLRTQIDGGTLGNVSSSDNGLGWNLGGGVMGYFADHIGVRGDLRYMRGFNENDLGFDTGDNLQALRFWRASVGVVFR